MYRLTINRIEGNHKLLLCVSPEFSLLGVNNGHIYLYCVSLILIVLILKNGIHTLLRLITVHLTYKCMILDWVYRLVYTFCDLICSIITRNPSTLRQFWKLSVIWNFYYVCIFITISFTVIFQAKWKDKEKAYKSKLQPNKIIQSHTGEPEVVELEGSSFKNHH